MAMLSWLSPIFGRKPRIAPFDYLDLTDEQKKALEGNIANMPKIQELGNLFQQFYLDQMDTAFGGSGIFRKIMASAGSTTQEMLDQAGTMLKGEVPDDVLKAIQRSSAYQSLTGGFMGSAMAGANAARNLGLTSLDMISKGANLAGAAGNAAQRWAALSGSGAMQGMLITPAQQSALDLQQSMIKHNLKQQKENVDAARDPVLGGLSDIVETLTAAYVGSLGGGKVGSTKNINNAPKDELGGANASFTYQENAPPFGDSTSGYPMNYDTSSIPGSGGSNPAGGSPESEWGGMYLDTSGNPYQPTTQLTGSPGTISSFGSSFAGPNAGTAASLNQLLALLQGSTFNQSAPQSTGTTDNPWHF